jgi:hypothetical protein
MGIKNIVDQKQNLRFMVKIFFLCLVLPSSTVPSYAIMEVLRKNPFILY